MPPAPTLTRRRFAACASRARGPQRGQNADCSATGEVPRLDPRMVRLQERPVSLRLRRDQVVRVEMVRVGRRRGRRRRGDPARSPATDERVRRLAMSAPGGLDGDLVLMLVVLPFLCSRKPLQPACHRAFTGAKPIRATGYRRLVPLSLSCRSGSDEKGDGAWLAAQRAPFSPRKTAGLGRGVPGARSTIRVLNSNSASRQRSLRQADQRPISAGAGPPGAEIACRPQRAASMATPVGS